MVRLHYSLTKKITMAGISEKSCYVIWISVLMVAVGGGQWWFVLVGALMHTVCLALTKLDDSFFEIALKAIKLPEHLE